MNQHIVPEFEMEEDGSIPWSSGFFHDRQSKMAEEEELLELLWQNGQVVMQNQARRPLKKPLLPLPKFHLEDAPSLLHHVLPHKPPAAAAGDGGPSTASDQQLYIQEDEMASWLQYPLDDAADFCSDLLYSQSMPVASAAGCCPRAKPPAARPPPRRPPEGEPDKAAANFAMFSRLKGKAAAQVQSASKKMGEMESTVVGSSVTPAAAQPARVASGNRAVGSERHGGGTCDPTVTSSSGGFGASAGDRKSKPPASDNRKRKGREGDEVEGLSEDAEFDYVEEKKAARRSNSTRRTRAAEVHNLSERRRRDRINEKMKDLQELIPHCNKSDKASMLDEAIEYLKSLQLQVQMMCMGFGMAPMVFPGIQHYLSPMGMRMGMGLGWGLGMGMGMGMGVGMNMDMSASSLNRPMLPFPPVLPPTPAQGSAPHMGHRLPIPPSQMQHIPLSDQPRAPTGQTDPAFNLVGLQIPSAQPHMHVADPYQQYLSLHHISMPPQGQAAAPPASTYNETEAHGGN